jgi:hypothetical protein
VRSYVGNSQGETGWVGGMERHVGPSNACRGAPRLLDSRGTIAAWPTVKAARRQTGTESDRVTRVACTEGRAIWVRPCPYAGCPSGFMGVPTTATNGALDRW